MISLITPPPELEQQWRNQWMCQLEDLHPAFGHDYQKYVIAQAAQWGADQELEACINYFHEYDPSWSENSELITGLRAARRPKPPSLKEQAYDALDTYIYGEPDPKDKERTYNTIRQALEQLND